MLVSLTGRVEGSVSESWLCGSEQEGDSRTSLVEVERLVCPTGISDGRQSVCSRVWHACARCVAVVVVVVGGLVDRRLSG